MRIILADLRYTWRRACRQPGVTLSIILLLALGMGGVTAVFNPIYSTIFAPLPFLQPEQLVRIGGGIPMFNAITGGFEHEEILGRIFSDTFAYQEQKIIIRILESNKEIEVNGLMVPENFFAALGVKPLMGSIFSGNEDRIGFIVSHGFWRKELMGKADVIGSYLGAPTGDLLPIAGIMPEGFNFPFDTDVWMCVRSGNSYGNLQDSIQIVGRLRPGVSVTRAAEELRTIKTDITMDIIQGNIRRSGSGPVLQSLQVYLYGDQRPMLRMLGATSALFLALVCAGVVNLLIAQGTKRKQEIATRLIYGATRRDLVFQLLRETLPLVMIGGLAGWWLSEIASTWMWAQMPALRGGTVDVPVKIAFWASLVLLVTLIGGLVPSLYATGLDLNAYIKSASGEKRRFLSTREFLVGVQLSLALALLIGVGVLIRSMMFNVDIPIGWSSRDIAVVTVKHQSSTPGFSVIRFGEERQYAGLNHSIRSEVRAIPGIMAVGVVSPIPFSVEDVSRNRSRSVAYKTPPSQYIMIGVKNWDVEAINVSVSPDTFDMLGIPLVLGRHFSEKDTAYRLEYLVQRIEQNGGAAIINQVLAERLWPGENPIGKVFYDDRKASREVVGVVRNYHHFPGSRDFIPTIYSPYSGIESNFLVRLRPGASLQNFHSNLRQRLSGFPLESIEVKPLNEYVKDATSNQRLTLQLLIGFAVLGIIVSGLGVYATATLMAAERTRETGIRMAMGAQTWDILKLAFWRGIRAILVGLPFGLFLAWVLAKVLSSYLVQVKIDDLLSWIISCAILLVIATIAALIPALRASRVNPMDALRKE